MTAGGGLGGVVGAALAEDLGPGDITTAALVPAGRQARGSFVARTRLVVAGLEPAREVFRQLDPQVRFRAATRDGETVDAGGVVARVEGPASALLAGERTALNFLMRLSGIATATRAAVEELLGTGVVLLDTRKTAPGLRALDKAAVAAGGGRNHRRGLFDAVLIKDTHQAVVGGLERALAAARAAGHELREVTVEVGTLDELRRAIDAGAGRALLDNMDLDTLRAAVALGRGRIVLEASGGLRPGALRAVAETGVDCLSLGWLTHSAPAADLALELEPVE